MIVHVGTHTPVEASVGELIIQPQKHSLLMCLVAQSCLTLWDPMDCSLPGSSVHGIFQATVLGWIAISFSRGSSQPRDRTRVSHIVDRCLTVWATREVIWWNHMGMKFCMSACVRCRASQSSLSFVSVGQYIFFKKYIYIMISSQILK